MPTFRPDRTRLLLRSLWLAAAALVIAGSLLPGDSPPMRELALLDINDKVQHFLAYAALAFIPAIHERLRVLILAALALAAMGVLLEYGQLLPTVGRDFEIGDMIADAAGVCAGAACGWALRARLGLAPDR